MNKLENCQRNGVHQTTHFCLPESCKWPRSNSKNRTWKSIRKLWLYIRPQELLQYRPQIENPYDTSLEYSIIKLDTNNETSLIVRLKNHTNKYLFGKREIKQKWQIFSKNNNRTQYTKTYIYNQSSSFRGKFITLITSTGKNINELISKLKDIRTMKEIKLNQEKCKLTNKIGYIVLSVK